MSRDPRRPDRRAFLLGTTGMTAALWAGGSRGLAAAGDGGRASAAIGDADAFYAEEGEALGPLRERGVRADPYRAGRTLAMGRRGMVATSHPAAVQAGLEMLRAGGTAMDAAVAAAAVLNVVEPMSTGMGGDAFFQYYEAEAGRLHGLNGSGRSPRGLSREHFHEAGQERIDPHSWEAVTVPGAVDAWAKGVERFGNKGLGQVLGPAIRHAEEGFPVAEVIGHVWSQEAAGLRDDEAMRRTYLADGEAPAIGSIFRNPRLGESLRTVAEGGRDAFYQGPIARRIVRHVRERGGFHTEEDFAAHESEWVEPISTNYRGYDCYQIPPNGQGIGVLLMLNLLRGYDLSSMRHNSPEMLHLLIEAKKLAYADLYEYIADPAFGDVPVEALLSEEYAERRRGLIRTDRAAEAVDPGLPEGSDTVYVTAVDEWGNACSFINSIYWLFGSRKVAGDTGIILQNRGAGFTLERGHFNEYAPGKRPYHTIIPGMVLRDGGLYLSYGLMGGPVQPQGHVQFLVHHLDFGLNIQQANDVPRWHHTSGLEVLLEHGYPATTIGRLAGLGHRVVPAGGLHFGGAQAIMPHPEYGTYLGSSDPRKDGVALGY